MFVSRVGSSPRLLYVTCELFFARQFSPWSQVCLLLCAYLQLQKRLIFIQNLLLMPRKFSLGQRACNNFVLFKF